MPFLTEKWFTKKHNRKKSAVYVEDQKLLHVILVQANKQNTYGN